MPQCYPTASSNRRSGAQTAVAATGYERGRDAGGDPGPVTGRAVDGEGPAECLDAVAETTQAAADALGCASAAVVDDLEVKGVGGRAGAYPYRRRGGVL